MADPRYDPATFAAKATEARQLAESARAAFRADISERGARLGISRDELAAEIHGKREQAQAAERQAKRELAEAEKLDRSADVLERTLIKPDPSARGLGEHIRDEELAERVAEQRALADAARARATAADSRADNLETEAIRLRDDLVGIERQLAAEPARRQAIEDQLDRLDDSATHFGEMARNANRIAEQERIASDAELRGDQATVDRAHQLIESSRDSIDWAVKRQLPQPDGAVLLQIGVTVPAGFTDPPVVHASRIGEEVDGSPGAASAGDGESTDDGTVVAVGDLTEIDPDLIELHDPSDSIGQDADPASADFDVLTGVAAFEPDLVTAATSSARSDSHDAFVEEGLGDLDLSSVDENAGTGFESPEPAHFDDPAPPTHHSEGFDFADPLPVVGAVAESNGEGFISEETFES